MKISKVVEYQNCSVLWIKRDAANENTKLGKKIKSIEKQIIKALKLVSDRNEEFEIQVNDINSDNALTDTSTKKFIYDILKDKEGNETQQYAYTPESRKKRDKEIRAARKKYEADIEVIFEREVELSVSDFVTELPPNLTASEIEAFSGIIIKPSEENTPEQSNG